jgi:hypothetical protein
VTQAGLQYGVSVIVVRYSTNWGVSKVSTKLSSTKFQENPFSGSRVVTCRQMDGRGETMLPIF